MGQEVPVRGSFATLSHPLYELLNVVFSPLTDRDPRVRRPGAFDFERFREVEIDGGTVRRPDLADHLAEVQAPTSQQAGATLHGVEARYQRCQVLPGVLDGDVLLYVRL